MSRKKIIILANYSKAGVAELVESLRPWFEQRVEILAVISPGQPLPAEGKSADLCMVFGGDGTLLTAARMLAGTDIPLLGVNMGKLGFLADFNIEHMRKHFDDILANQPTADERMMLEVCVKRGGSQAFSSPVANDIAISAGEPFRMIDLNITQGDQQVARYLGDGIVIATPTGTTGYNLSAGGPILDPTLDAVVITPVASHTLSVRPIVVRSDLTIRITATQVNPGTSIIVDGQVTSGLFDGDVIEVRKAAYRMRFIPHLGWTFFKTLTHKLHWGHSPHHSQSV